VTVQKLSSRMDQSRLPGGSERRVARLLVAMLEIHGVTDLDDQAFEHFLSE
jgi:hypothetical protein